MHHNTCGFYSCALALVLHSFLATGCQMLSSHKAGVEDDSKAPEFFLSEGLCPVDCPLGLGDLTSEGCANASPPAALVRAEAFSAAETQGVRQPRFQSAHHLCKNSSTFKLPAAAHKKPLTKVLLVDTDSSSFQGVATFIQLFVRGLQKKGWQVVNPKRDLPGPDVSLNLQKKLGTNKAPDIVAFIMLRNETLDLWTQLPGLPFLKALVVEDLNYPHDIEPLERSYAWMDVIFARYPEHMVHFVDQAKMKSCYVFPHAATQPFFVDPPAEKSHKAFLSGAILDGWYPLREVAAKSLESGKTPHWAMLQHPGYEKPLDPLQQASDYAKAIAQYDIALAGGPYPNKTYGPYVIAKHFEIPATGTVLLTDKLYAPYLQSLGMVENAHFITASAGDLDATVAHWLSPERRNDLKVISEQGRALVGRCHHMDQRIELFDRTVEQEFYERYFKG